MDTDPTLLQTLRRLRRHPEDSPYRCIGSMVLTGRGLRFCVLHGQGLGRVHAPGPLFVSRMTYASPIDSTFLPAREHVCERSASAPPPSVPLCFPQTPFCCAKGILTFNKRCPGCRLHVHKAGGLSSVASYSKPLMNWNPMNQDFFLLLFGGGKS